MLHRTCTVQFKCLVLPPVTVQRRRAPIPISRLTRRGLPRGAPSTQGLSLTPKRAASGPDLRGAELPYRWLTYCWLLLPWLAGVLNLGVKRPGLRDLAGLDLHIFSPNFASLAIYSKHGPQEGEEGKMHVRFIVSPKPCMILSYVLPFEDSEQVGLTWPCMFSSPTLISHKRLHCPIPLYLNDDSRYCALRWSIVKSSMKPAIRTLSGKLCGVPAAGGVF